MSGVNEPIEGVNYYVWHRGHRCLRGHGATGARGTNAWSKAFAGAHAYTTMALAEEEVARLIERGEGRDVDLMAVEQDLAARWVAHAWTKITTGSNNVTLDSKTTADVTKGWSTVLRLSQVTFLDLDPEHALRVESKHEGDYDLDVEEAQAIVTKLSAWIAKVRGAGPPTPREQAAARSFMVEIAVAAIPPEAAFVHRCAYCGNPTSQGPIRLAAEGKFYPSCCSRDECLDRWSKTRSLEERIGAAT